MPRSTKKTPAKKARSNGATAKTPTPGYWLLVANNSALLSTMLEGGVSTPVRSGVPAGQSVVVNYFQEPATLGRPDVAFRKVKLHYRIDGQACPPVEVAGSDSRLNGYVRVPTAVAIPATAKSALEYWFEIDTESGEKLWDSNLGRNFQLSIVPEPTVETTETVGPTMLASETRSLSAEAR